MRNDPISKRWADAPSEGDALEQRASRLMRQAGPAEPLTPQQLEKVWSRLKPTVASSSKLHVAIALAVLGAALAAGLWQLSKTGAPPAASAPAVLVPASAPAPVASAMPPPPSLPAPSASPVPARKAAPSARPSAVPVPAPAPRPGASPEDEEDRLAAESRLIARAVQELRQERDPAATLATLDEHARQFPQGVLAREAQMVRIEALLASGQRQAALDLLEQTNLDDLPRGEELSLVEAELLSEAGRCEQAMRLFARALAAPRGDELEERARYGRAVCRAHVGDVAGSERDLLDYLEKFPEGRFAAAVHARLGVLQ